MGTMLDPSGKLHMLSFMQAPAHASFLGRSVYGREEETEAPDPEGRSAKRGFGTQA